MKPAREVKGSLLVGLIAASLLTGVACGGDRHRPRAPRTQTVDAAVNPADVRFAIDAITARSFGEDIARIEGVRDGSGPALRRAAAYVADELTASGFVVRRQLVRAEAGSDDAIHENIIGELAPSGPRDDDAPIVIATAHIDSVSASPGADDNASGVATLLAIARTARRMIDRGAAPTATLRVIAFALEEEGFVGSMHYARSLSWAERKRIRAVYNFDMVAFTRRGEGSQEWPDEASVLADLRGGHPLRRTGDFIGAVTLSAEHEDDPDPLAPLHEARGFVPHLVVETLVLPRVLRPFAPDLERGDHVAFWALGIPAVDIGDTAELRSPHYHAPSDTLSTLDLVFASSVARWASAGVILATHTHTHPRAHANEEPSVTTCVARHDAARRKTTAPTQP